MKQYSIGYNKNKQASDFFLSSKMEQRKLKRFNILLDDESLLYFPGSFLTGKVLLELDENTPATGLYFHIIGEGVVRLTNKGKNVTQVAKSGNNNSSKKKALANDRENYIDFRMRLLGEPNNNEEIDSNDEEEEEDEDDDVNGHQLTAKGRKSTRSQRQQQQQQSDSDSVISASSSSNSEDNNNSLNSHSKKHGRKQQRKVMILSPGVHTFPFKLGLPPSLPSTFLGSHGWVQYFCRAILKEPSGLVHKNQQVFIIINPIDLNSEPVSLQQPFFCEAEERVQANKCSSAGTISCRVRLDRAGFVPGENILISANIENATRSSIRKTRAILTETVEYRAKSQIIQAETRELVSVERGKIASKSSDNWKREALHIPALPPTNLRGCQLIKIHYDVYVS